MPQLRRLLHHYDDQPPEQVDGVRHYSNGVDNHFPNRRSLRVAPYQPTAEVEFDRCQTLDFSGNTIERSLILTFN